MSPTAIPGMEYPRADLDARDQAILAEREALMNKIKGPREGDWVRFSDGVMHQICRVHNSRSKKLRKGVQTTSEGSFHLGYQGHVDYSGALDPLMDLETLTLTGETRDTTVWIFHHGVPQGGGGVHADIPFRVYETTLDSKWWRSRP